MKAEDTLIKDEDRLAMSDIKNRWLHSLSFDNVEYRKSNFEHDCIGEIISTQRQIQANISFKAGMKEIVDWLTKGGLCEHKIARNKCAICWARKLKELE